MSLLMFFINGVMVHILATIIGIIWLEIKYKNEGK